MLGDLKVARLVQLNTSSGVCLADQTPMAGTIVTFWGQARITWTNEVVMASARPGASRAV